MNKIEIQHLEASKDNQIARTQFLIEGKPANPLEDNKLCDNCLRDNFLLRITEKHFEKEFEQENNSFLETRDNYREYIKSCKHIDIIEDNAGNNICECTVVAGLIQPLERHHEYKRAELLQKKVEIFQYLDNKKSCECPKTYSKELSLKDHWNAIDRHIFGKS